MRCQDVDPNAVGAQHLLSWLDAESGIRHRELLVLGIERGVIGVVVVERGRVRARDDLLVLVVEVEEAEVAETALRQALVVEQDLVNLAVVGPVTVVVEAVDAGVRIVVVTREHHPHVGVRGDDLVIDLLRYRPETSRGQHVLVQVQHHDPLGVLGENLVHPRDLVIPGTPAHVEHQKVDAAGGDEVVVAAVVLVVAAPPGVCLVAVSPEVGAVVGVVDFLVADVVVARQHAVGQPRSVELPVLGVGIVPLPQLVVVIDDVPGVEQVLQVEV